MKIILCVLAYALLVEAKPSTDIFNYEDNKFGEDSVTSNIRECHGIECPIGTVGCVKTTKTSTDSKTLMLTIQCEDLHGNVLNSAVKTSPNQYEGTHISSFSFTGQYSIGGGQYMNNKPSIKHSNPFNKDGNNFDTVETFD